MVSVIIPSYNHYNYIGQRIESVLAQTYIDIEVIILDDFSPDGSINIIEQYRDSPRVSNIILNEVNSGSVFKQWKKGIDLAKGEYIWIAESDDFADKDFLTKMIPVLENDQEIGLIYCNSKIVYENNFENNQFNTLNDLRKFMFKNEQWDSSFTMSGAVFLKKYLSLQCGINNASSAIFRRSCFDKITVNMGDFRFAGDWAVYNNIAQFYKISFFNEVLSYYRDHNANASKKSNTNNVIYIENYKVFNNYYNYLQKNNKWTFYFLFLIRRSLLQILITDVNRKVIFRQYKKINKKMIFKALFFLPIVFTETKARNIMKYFLKIK